MEDTVSVSALKKLLENKSRKKILIKVMWSEEDKVTLFILPNMKINSFIHDEKEGYLFYDHEGNPIKNDIPCVLSQHDFADGKVKLDGSLKIYGKNLSKEDIHFLKKEEPND